MNLKNAAPEKFGPIKTFFYRLFAEPSVEPMHRRIAAEVPVQSGSVLDLGCGTGKVARLIASARPGVRVVGIDSSEPMIRAAKKAANPPNVEFRHGTVEQGASAGEFQFALSVLSFHHWEEPAQTLAGVHRALVPGGKFWIYEMDPEASASSIRTDRAPLWGFFRLPMGWQRRMARDHGFSRAEIEKVVRPVVGRTPLRELRVNSSGSMLRLELS